MSAGELLRGYEARRFSPVEVIDAVGARIDAIDGGLGAFTTLCLDRAREEAAAGRSGPLAGVPFAAKDLFDSEGVRTTYGSRMFESNVPSATPRRSIAARRGRDPRRQGADARVRVGITSINQRRRVGLQPVGRDARARRVERRVGGGSGGPDGPARAWD